jgi:ABC-2 type transport system permease protein
MYFCKACNDGKIKKMRERMDRLWAIIYKEFRHIWRDKRTLFLVTLSPGIILVLFSYLFGMQVQNVRLGIWDNDQTAMSRRFVSSLTSDGKFIVTMRANNYDALREGMMAGEINLGIVIPNGFEADLDAAKRVPVQAIADGSDAITLSRALGLTRERVGAFNQRIEVSEAGRLPINVQPQVWYTPSLDSMYAMVPGVLPIALVLPALAIALAVTRERELGSFETLITTPIGALEYILGKLIPYIVFGLLSAIIAILFSIFWFGVPLRGSPITLAIVTIIYLFAMLSQSLFISSFLDSQGTAMRIILLIFFVPSFFMSGIIIPANPDADILTRSFSFMLSSTHFVGVSRGVFLKGWDWSQIWVEVLTLFALGAVPLVLSLITFKKQV